MDAAMGRLLQQPKARGVIMKAGEDEQQSRYQHTRTGRQLAKTDLWVEFFL